MSASFAVDLVVELQQKIPQLRRAGATKVHVAAGTGDRVRTVNDLWASAQLVAYSPSVESGISYTGPPFYRTYGAATNGVGTVTC